MELQEIILSEISHTDDLIVIQILSEISHTDNLTVIQMCDLTCEI